MPTLLSQASSSDIFILCLCMLAVGMVCGVISNMVLADVGFGIAINGFVVLLGSVLGVWLRLAL